MVIAQQMLCVYGGRMTETTRPTPDASPTGADDDAHRNTAVDEPLTPLRKNREYLTWLTGDLLLDMGRGIAGFAFPLMTLYVTDSAGAVGIVGLIQGAGMVMGMIPGGLLADRVDRRRMRIIGAFGGAVIQIALVGVLVTGVATVPLLSILGFGYSLWTSVLGGASGPMLKQIVHPRQLPRAVAVNEGRGAAVELGSGPAGGALLAVHLALPAVTLVLGQIGALISTLLLRDDYRPRTVDAAPTRVRDDLTEALRWCLAQPIRLQLSVVAALVNLGTNGVILTVTLMLAAQGVPAAQIGLLSSVLAASILVGALFASWIVANVPTGLLTVGQLLLMAGIAVAVPFAPNMWVIATLYAAFGLGVPALNAASSGFFMHITPKRMLGRVQSLSGLMSMGLMPLAPAIAGWGIERAGATPTMAVFAAINVLAALIAVAGPHLRRVPVSSRWEKHAVAEGLTEARSTDGSPRE